VFRRTFPTTRYVRYRPKPRAFFKNKRQTTYQKSVKLNDAHLMSLYSDLSLLASGLVPPPPLGGGGGGTYPGVDSACLGLVTCPRGGEGWRANKTLLCLLSLHFLFHHHPVCLTRLVSNHRLNMDVDLQSLFGLHVT
jgi:hypothetical protein